MLALFDKVRAATPREIASWKRGAWRSADGREFDPVEDMAPDHLKNTIAFLQRYHGRVVSMTREAIVTAPRLAYSNSIEIGETEFSYYDCVLAFEALKKVDSLHPMYRALVGAAMRRRLRPAPGGRTTDLRWTKSDAIIVARFFERDPKLGKSILMVRRRETGSVIGRREQGAIARADAAAKGGAAPTTEAQREPEPDPGADPLGGGRFRIF